MELLGIFSSLCAAAAVTGWLVVVTDLNLSEYKL